MYPVQTPYTAASQTAIYDQPLYQMNHLKNNDKSSLPGKSFQQHSSSPPVEGNPMETPEASSTDCAVAQEFAATVASEDFSNASQNQIPINNNQDNHMVPPAPQQPIEDSTCISRNDSLALDSNSSHASHESPQAAQLQPQPHPAFTSVSPQPPMITTPRTMPASTMMLPGHNQTIFECAFCKKVFTKQFALRVHEQVHLGEKPYSCNICNKSFAQQIHLRNHQRVHTGEKPFQCTICNKAFSQAGNLKLHLRIHSGDKPFTCDICSKAFSQRNSLNDHKRFHTGNMFFCKFCKRAFCNQFFLENHERSHTGEKPFTCDYCGKLFAQRGNFRTHLRIHTGEKPFICEVCGKAFSQRNSLNDHNRLHTGNLFFCQYCKKAFCNQFFLKIHERIHTGELFYCTFCKKGFCNEFFLRNHERVHTGDKPYDCQFCNKTFAQRGNLKTHLRIHTGERPFICDICDKAFSQRNNLNDHKRLHSGDLYFCSFCKKAFCNQFFLKTHERTHTGEKPFECEFCHEKFSQQGNLKTHLRTHTGEKPFACGQCGKNFAQKANLNNHKCPMASALNRETGGVNSNMGGKNHRLTNNNDECGNRNCDGEVFSGSKQQPHIASPPATMMKDSGHDKSPMSYNSSPPATAQSHQGTHHSNKMPSSSSHVQKSSMKVTDRLLQQHNHQQSIVSQPHGDLPQVLPHAVRPQVSNISPTHAPTSPYLHSSLPQSWENNNYVWSRGFPMPPLLTSTWPNMAGSYSCGVKQGKQLPWNNLQAMHTPSKNITNQNPETSGIK